MCGWETGREESFEFEARVMFKASPDFPGPTADTSDIRGSYKHPIAIQTENHKGVEIYEEHM